MEIKTNDKYDTRAGFRTTSILEREVREYIDAHIINNRYIGELVMLERYRALQEYNQREEKKE